MCDVGPTVCWWCESLSGLEVEVRCHSNLPREPGSPSHSLSFFFVHFLFLSFMPSFSLYSIAFPSILMCSSLSLSLSFSLAEYMYLCDWRSVHPPSLACPRLLPPLLLLLCCCCCIPKEEGARPNLASLYTLLCGFPSYNVRKGRRVFSPSCKSSIQTLDIELL